MCCKLTLVDEDQYSGVEMWENVTVRAFVSTTENSPQFSILVKNI